MTLRGSYRQHRRHARQHRGDLSWALAYAALHARHASRKVTAQIYDGPNDRANTEATRELLAAGLGA